MKLEDWGWVTAQFVLGGALLLVPSGGHWMTAPWGMLCEWGAWIIAGSVLGLAALNLGKALTPTPTPNGKSELVTKGLYSHVRHPMYSVVLLASWLFTLPAGGPWRFALAVILTVFFHLKARREEGLLIRQFEGYKEYMQRVPRFVPRPFRRQETHAPDT